MKIIVDIDLVVDIKFVILHEARCVRIQFLDLPQMFSQLRSTFSGSLAQILADMNAGVLLKVSLPQHLLSVLEMLKGNKNRSGASNLWTWKEMQSVKLD